MILWFKQCRAFDRVNQNKSYAQALSLGLDAKTFVHCQLSGISGILWKQDSNSKQQPI